MVTLKLEFQIVDLHHLFLLVLLDLVEMVQLFQLMEVLLHTLAVEAELVS